MPLAVDDVYLANQDVFALDVQPELHREYSRVFYEFLTGPAIPAENRRAGCAGRVQFAVAVGCTKYTKPLAMVCFVHRTVLPRFLPPPA